MKNLIIAVACLFSAHAYGQGQFQQESAGMLTFTSSKIMQLAEAVPEEKFAWLPQEGIRSFAEVFEHLISSNYFFASKLGAQTPEDALQGGAEKRLSKEQIKTELKRSYDLVISAINNTMDDSLSVKVEYPFPGEFTNMSSILIVMTHANEHLGQLIAYSRMNGIVPPWSKPPQEQQ